MKPCATPHPWSLEVFELMPGFAVMVWRCSVCETRKTQHPVMPALPSNRAGFAGYAGAWQQRYVNWR